MVKRIGRFLVAIGLLTLILAKGAAFPIALLSACLPIGLAAALACAAPPRNPALARAFYLCLGLTALLAAFVLLQATTLPGHAFADPVWADAHRLLGSGLTGGEAGAISVNPAATRLALFTLLSPFLLYAATLALFDSNRAAEGLIRGLGLLGIAFALFGLIQISILPDSLLFFEKRAYLDSLTSVLVNRNTAGTFLGVASLVVLCCFLLTLTEARNDRPIRAFLEGHIPRAIRLRAALLLVGFVVTLLALFITVSRGALLSTLAAYLVVVPLLVASGPPRGEPSARTRRLLMALLAVLALLAVAALFGAQAIARIERQSVDVDRLCVYAATWRGIEQNWLFGTGFGTFQEVFPRYRLADCGNIYAAFDRAHNFYLEGLLGLGLVFVPATALVYTQVLRTLWTGHRTRRRLRFVPILSLGAVVLVSLHGLVDFSLQIPGMAAFFAVYLGASTVLCHGRAKKGGLAEEQMSGRDHDV